jgi:hypothetical protein
MKESLTVFLCSTYSDLVEERAAVLGAIQRLKLQHDSMEFFGARPTRPIETCLQEVRKSDLLVVIAAHRYGSFVPDEKVSFAEAEYREGYRLGRPCLVYFRDEGVPVLPGSFETRPVGARALRRFKKLLQERHTVRLFRGAHDLALQVAVDLTQTIEALKLSAAAAAHHPPPDPAAQFRELWDEAASSGLDPADLRSRIRRMIGDLQVAQHRRGVRVFLSHAPADGEIVRAFAAGLQRHGVEVWWDGEPASGDGGVVEQISRGLERAEFVVFFVSSASLSRRWTTIELNYAITHRLTSAGGARIVPVLLDDVPIPSVLTADHPYIDLRGGEVRGAVERMMHTIRQPRDDA